MNDSQPNSYARTAWLVVILLVPVALLNYLDRQMLAAMKSSMMGDIPDISTKANWGLVLGSFKWVYAILSPVGGYLADRLSRRHVICVSLFVWSAVTWATGHVTSFNELIAARSIMGISEAFYIPAALALITEYHLGPTRSRAVGFHQMGIYVGVILGGFSGYVADSPAYGWRWAFSLCGIIGVVYAIPLFAFLRNPPRPADAKPQPSPIAAAGELFTNLGFILLVLYFTLPALAGWVVQRLDAGHSERAIRSGARQGGRIGGAVCANRFAGWRRGGRLVGRSLDEQNDTRTHLRQRAGNDASFCPRCLALAMRERLLWRSDF